MAKLVSVRRGLWEQLYVPELLRALAVTLRHFFVNLFGRREIVTVRYPEERRPYPERFRGVHRLMLRADGTVRCVACMMCSTICPAGCIHIEADERLDASGIEKYPLRFELDELVCVMCGLCVEACPCDAIRMDTARHMPPVDHRAHARLDKAALMRRGSSSIAVQGGAGPDWREHYAALGSLRAIYDPEERLKRP